MFLDKEIQRKASYGIAEGWLAVLSRSQGGVETAGIYDRAIMDVRLLQQFSWVWPIGLA